MTLEAIPMSRPMLMVFHEDQQHAYYRSHWVDTLFLSSGSAINQVSSNLNGFD